MCRLLCVLFFFNDTATTEIYTLSLHDALPISPRSKIDGEYGHGGSPGWANDSSAGDRKSTRLNSSHPSISYAVFCLKKKNKPPSPRFDGRLSLTGAGFPLPAPR